MSMVIHNSKKIVRYVGVIFTAILPLVLTFFSSDLSRPVMVFDVGSSLPTLLGPKAAHADILSILANTKNTTTGPTSCAGKNYITGGTITQPPAQTGDRTYCYGMYSCDSSKPETCINPVNGKQMPDGYTCRVGMYQTGTGDLKQRALPLGVADCARQGVEWRFTQAAGGKRMPNVGASIDRNGCYTEFSWFSGNAKATGIGDARVVCPSQNTANAVYSSSSSSSEGATTGNGQTNNNNNQGGGIGGLNQIVSEPFGEITKADCTSVEGWALDPRALTTPISIKVYVKKQNANAEQNLNLQVTANLARTNLFPSSVATALRIDPTAFSKHGFEFDLPNTVSAGDTVILYAVKASGSWVPFLDDVVINCSGVTAGANTEAREALTKVLNYLSTNRPTTGTGGGAVNTIVGGSAPKTWQEQLAFCQANPAQVCLANAMDLGQSCPAMGRGQVTGDELTERCRIRFEVCQHDGRSALGGFCDSQKYAECRKAGMVNKVGILDYDACDDALIKACDLNGRGDQAKAVECDPACVLNKVCDPAAAIRASWLLV